MTDEQKKQEIDRQIASVIRHAEERIAKYAAQAAENYRNFFHWNAGNMYEAYMELEFFADIRGITKAGDMDEVTRRLERHISNIERELIDSSAFGSCTNEVINLEHRLELDGKREIRQKLKRLLSTAKYEG